MDNARCKHGVNPSWCALCAPKKKDPTKLKRPQRSTGFTVHGLGSHETSRKYQEGYVVVSPRGLRSRKDLNGCDHRIGFVHIDGFPNLWLVRWLLEHLPKLHTIQVTPKNERNLGREHRRLCEERNVRLVTGHHNPNMAWEEGRNASPHYRGQREFLVKLESEQKALFDELVQMGFHAAILTARYFCLRDEEFKPQREVAQEVDFPTLLQGPISAYINSVFCYLDPTFKAAKRAVAIAGAMRQRVVRLRAILAEAASREEMAKRLGLNHLPEGMPLSRLDVLEAVVKASKDRDFGYFAYRCPREHEVVALRYGLSDGKYRTLEEIGQRLGVTRERIRQLEEKAFAELGIEDE